MTNQNIPTKTLTSFIHAQERKHQDATGELTELLNTIALGVKIISNLVATAGFKGLHGYTGKKNIQGEDVQILDEQADQILVDLLGTSGQFGLLVSEERDKIITAEQGREDAKYVVAFDPLDGSSNLGSNIPVGTIFGIWKKINSGKAASHSDFLQAGRHLVAAGYAVYGAKTSFVYSAGQGAHGFTLDPSIGEFLLTEEQITVPDKGRILSVNEGNAFGWEPKIAEFIKTLKQINPDLGTPYASRYVGSLVADFDRTMRKGGIYIYPADSKNPNGKLRLLYEVMPLSFVIEQAGGRSVDGKQNNLLDVVPSDIHQRSPMIFGGKCEIDWFEKFTK